MSERARGDYGYTGGSYEVDLFGALTVRSGYKTELASSVNEKGFLTFGRAMELIRKYYAEDPTNPKKPFAKEFRMRIAQILQLIHPEDLKRLRFYSAVGKKELSPLDFFHGIDSWIEYTSKEGTQPTVVTLDGTMREQKDDAKADLLVKGVPDPTEDKSGFATMVDFYAHRAATLFGADAEKKSEKDEIRTASGVVRRRPKTP